MMRSSILFLPLLFFAAAASGSAQTSTNQEIQSAAGRTTDELNRKSTEIDKAVQNHASRVQDKINAIQAPTTNVIPVTVTLEDGGQKKLLMDAVQSFVAYAEKKEHLYSVLSNVFIGLSAGLALLGGIFSFLSKNKTAGIISLIVAAVVGLSNAYPITPLAQFYGNLKSQAKTIVADCTLGDPYTQTLYTADLAQYKLLLVYDEQGRPSIGNYDNSAHALQQESKSVSLAAKNADIAKAASNEIVGFPK